MMRRFATSAVLFALACTAAAQQPDGKKKTDLELIQGTWLITGLESGGKQQSDKAFKGNLFIFSKAKGLRAAVLVERGYPPVEFTFSLEPDKTPKEITLTTKGIKALGIYKLDGDDDLTISMSLGGSRPSEFATRLGGDTETFTLKRNRWERFIDQGLGYSIDFPGKPVEARRDVRIRGRKMDARAFTVRNELERSSYIVTVIDLECKNAREVDEALGAVQKAMVADLGDETDARVESERKLVNLPAGISEGREFNIAVRRPKSKDPGLMRVRLYASGEHVYALVVSGTDEVTRSPSVSRFWGSFTTLGEKQSRPRNRER
jgi:uncharacterized protein (TIGR03067 family)